MALHMHIIHLIMSYFVQHSCISFTWRSPKGCVWLCCVMLCLLQWLLLQPGEGLCQGCHASQERLNVSAFPTAPHVFFQSLSSNLTYHGFGEQCTQKDTARQPASEQDQQYNSKATTLPHSSHCRYYFFINNVPEEICFFFFNNDLLLTILRQGYLCCSTLNVSML